MRLVKWRKWFLRSLAGITIFQHTPSIYLLRINAPTIGQPDRINKFPMNFFGKNFGKSISELNVSKNPINYQCTLRNQLADIIKLHVDMLSSAMEFGIMCHSDS
jgi:hypothetical protein